MRQRFGDRGVTHEQRAQIRSPPQNLDHRRVACGGAPSLARVRAEKRNLLGVLASSHERETELGGAPRLIGAEAREARADRRARDERVERAVREAEDEQPGRELAEPAEVREDLEAVHREVGRERERLRHELVRRLLDALVGVVDDTVFLASSSSSAQRARASIVRTAFPSKYEPSSVRAR